MYARKDVFIIQLSYELYGGINLDIIVIGNGFDLAHDLKTTYKDFLEYCIARNSERLPMAVHYGTTFIDNIWLRHFIGRSQELGNTWIDLEKEIFNAIQTISKDIYNLSNGEIDCIFPIIFSVQKDIIDFSFNNIRNYFETARINYETNGKEYVNVETNDFSKLFTYIRNYHGFIAFLYDKLREFTKEFENYLINNVLSKLSEQSRYQLSLQSIDVLRGTYPLNILSFNYTNTFEKLYNGLYTDYGTLRVASFYIHGQISSSKECRLVLGTYSFENNNIPVEFNIFKKHNQRHKYGTVEAYQELLKKLNDPKVKPIFHVIGHSLDETDHSILKHVFLTNKNAVINIYYHNEEAQERLINNITEIIGEEEVMTKVRLIYQHDEKRGILKLKLKDLNTNMEPVRRA